MKTFVVIFAVFIESAATMGVTLFLGIRKKFPAFSLSLFWAVSAVLVVGFGFRALPEKKLLPICLLALAWGCGVLAASAAIARKYFLPLTAKTKSNDPKA